MWVYEQSPNFAKDVSVSGLNTPTHIFLSYTHHFIFHCRF